MTDQFSKTLEQQAQYRIRNYDQALELALELERLAGDKAGPELELALYLKGEALEKLGSFSQAKEALLRVEEIVRSRDKKNFLLLDIYECLGKACYAIGELDLALEYWSDCLELALEHQSIEHYIKAYTGVGGVYLYFGLFEDSLHHHLLALDFAKDLDNPVLSMMLNLWLGSDYNQLGEYEKAIEHLEQARVFYRRRADAGQVSEIIMHLGFSYLGMGSRNKASAAFKESIKIAEVNSHTWPLAMANLGLAQVLFEKERYSEALAYVATAKKYALENKSIHHEIKICKLTSDIYEALGDYQRALEIFERHCELKVQLANGKVKIQNKSAALKKLNRSEIRLKLLKAEQQKRNLENERIQQAAQFEIEKKSLLAINQAKSEFLAMVSHEVRTPLSGVIGMLRLALSQKNLPGLAREQVTIALENADLLLEIINDLLDASKIEAGKIKVEAIIFDLHKVIAQVAALFAPKAEEKGLSFVVDVAYLPMQGYIGDPTRIRQVLFNLISNAIKFTEQGSICLSAYRDGEQVKFSITDTGIGLDEQSLGRLFNKFEQADTSTTRKYGGTGLGLSICRALIELMHGSIAVTSQEGEGTCFRVDLPLEPAILSEEKLEESGVNEAIPFELKILYAEDILTNQLIVRSYLEDMGLDVQIVENGHDAIVALAQQQFDVVLMDGRMPIMDGLTATRWIRQGGYQGIDVLDPHAYIVALTANAGTEEQQAGVEAGMNDYLVKPIDPIKLKQALLKVCEYQQGRGKVLKPLAPPLLATQEQINPADREFLNHLAQAGVAVNDALPRLNGNISRLRRWLLQFFDDQKPFFAEIDEHVRLRDGTTLAMKVHALRGVAGTLGLSAMYEEAGQLERALGKFNKMGGIFPDFAPLERRWRHALQAISPLLGTQMPEVSKVDEINITLPEQLLDQALLLKTALQSNSLRARNRLQLLQELLDGDAFASSLAIIERALDRLDYPTALGALTAMLPEEQR